MHRQPTEPGRGDDIVLRPAQFVPLSPTDQRQAEVALGRLLSHYLGDAHSGDLGLHRDEDRTWDDEDDHGEDHNDER